MINRAPLLVLAGLLSGCSLLRPTVEVKSEPVPVVCDTSARPDSLDLADTPPTLVFNVETETWGFWFDSDLYADLAENIQAMRRHLRQSSAIRKRLVDCIEAHNRALAQDPASDS